jgi:ribulose-5-phosphate 4-epimerase/fuculose-1-phosphate aldolase
MRMSVPPLPSPRTPAQERLNRKRRLAAALRLFARFGFDEGAAGHITARDPENHDQFWINPFGVHFGQVRVSDLLLVDAEGAVISGDGRVNPAGFAIHSQVHAARPDAVSAAHAHSVYGRAWAALGRRLDPLTQDACAFYEDHEVFGSFGGVVLDAEEGKRIAACLGRSKAVILRNHGLLTVGGSVQEAAWWFIAMERACQVQLIAAAAGQPVPIDNDTARATAAVMGSAEVARLSFRSLYEDVVRAEPSLLG